MYCRQEKIIYASHILVLKNNEGDNNINEGDNNINEGDNNIINVHTESCCKTQLFQTCFTDIGQKCFTILYIIYRKNI